MLRFWGRRTLGLPPFHFLDLPIGVSLNHGTLANFAGFRESSNGIVQLALQLVNLPQTVVITGIGTVGGQGGLEFLLSLPQLIFIRASQGLGRQVKVDHAESCVNGRGNPVQALLMIRIGLIGLLRNLRNKLQRATGLALCLLKNLVSVGLVVVEVLWLGQHPKAQNQAHEVIRFQLQAFFSVLDDFVRITLLLITICAVRVNIAE